MFQKLLQSGGGELQIEKIGSYNSVNALNIDIKSLFPSIWQNLTIDNFVCRNIGVGYGSGNTGNPSYINLSYTNGVLTGAKALNNNSCTLFDLYIYYV